MEKWLDTREETMIEQVRRLSSHNEALSREVELLNTRIEMMCENCPYPGQAEMLSMQINRQRRAHNQAVYALEQERQEKDWQLDDAISSAEKCRIENRRLKAGY